MNPIDNLSSEDLASLESRIQGKVSLGDNECWIWIGSTAWSVRKGRVREKGNEYPVIFCKGKMLNVRRVMYTIYKGDTAGTLSLEAICNNSLCVNPDHLVRMLKRMSRGPKKGDQ